MYKLQINYRYSLTWWQRERGVSGIQFVIELFWGGGRWRDRRFEVDGQKEAGDSEAGDQEASLPQRLGVSSGRHQSQDQAWLPHQFSQSQIQKAEGTQGRYGWPHTLPAHWTNWVGLNHINLTSHLPLPHIPHNIIRLVIVSSKNCKRSFSLKSITWICMWEIYIYM